MAEAKKIFRKFCGACEKGAKREGKTLFAFQDGSTSPKTMILRNALRTTRSTPVLSHGGVTGEVRALGGALLWGLASLSV
jgi:hypothetical protein